MNQALNSYDDTAVKRKQHLVLQLVNACVLLVLIVIFMGGWTRINDAGLSCPDWPGCFGQLTVPNSQPEISAAAKLYPGVAVVQSKGWLEMLHRYLAGSLGLLVLVIAVIAIQLRKVPFYPYLLSFSLLALVSFQAVLGMWTVTLKLLPIIVTLHLFGGLLTMIVLLLLRAKLVTQKVTDKQWNKHNYSVLIGLIILFLQVLLGGWTSSNYAGWGCSDWLGCNPGIEVDYNFYNAFQISLDTSVSHQGGSLGLAERGAIQISHRFGAVLVMLYFIGFYFTLAKKQSWAKTTVILLSLLALQIVVGLLNIVYAIPTMLAMGHHFLAVLALICTTKLLIDSFGKVAKE
ncbi:MAG: COX15/CtaA family protein [Oceanospirillaceae bacterium]